VFDLGLHYHKSYYVLLLKMLGLITHTHTHTHCNLVQEAELDKQLLQPAATPTHKYKPQQAQQQGQPQQQLPSVPQQKAPPRKTPEEEELEALQVRNFSIWALRLIFCQHSCWIATCC
jgi:hypothetical protein